MDGTHGGDFFPPATKGSSGSAVPEDRDGVRGDVGVSAGPLRNGSNHFEVAIATAAMLSGLSFGAVLATVVGVRIEVPLMLMLVKFCLKTTHWFSGEAS